MPVIAFVPVRCGSKSIPFKNIKDFCGKPLVYWTLLALEGCESVDEVYVATDCQEIVKVVEGFAFGKVKIFVRSELNAQDSSSTESVMLEFLNSRAFTPETHFVLAQATSPLTKTKDYGNAIRLCSESSFDSVLSCIRTVKFLWNEKGEPVNYDYKNRPRRQDIKGEMIENGAIYVNTVGNILKFKNRLSGKIGIYLMPEYTQYEIDEEHDWVILEKLMERYSKKEDSMPNI